MERTTSDQTLEYIKNHMDIKNCLKKGVINYSSLARLIASELDIEKKTSKEAILMAARRYQERLKDEVDFEKNIKNLLAKSEIEIKNKIEVLIFQKNIKFSDIEEIQKEVKKESETFYLLEGSNNYTIIIPERFSKAILKKFKSHLIRRHEGLALIRLKSPEDIEDIPGIVYYLTSFFYENGVNITEVMSFWTDTVFTIKKEDVNKAISFLQF